MIRFHVLSLCFHVLAAASALHAQDLPVTKFTVMTRNVYVGANLQSIIAVDSTDELLAGMANVFNKVQQTDFQERAEALADEIQTHNPLLVGLQEAALWRTDDNADGPISDATDVAYDFLDILMDELASRNLNYETLIVYNGFDFEAPGLFDDGLMDVRFTDRDVILGRVTNRYDFSNAKKKTFNANFIIPTGLFGDITYKRGFTRVDVTDTFNDNAFRFINTHLEVFSGSVRQAQTQQLLNGPADTPANLPVVMVGDFNAQAEFSNVYDAIIEAGFDDAWEQEHPNNPGNTCCQDADLENENSELSWRIDFIFIDEAFSTLSAKRVGEHESDRTPSGLWPSDHAGVVARVKLD